MNFIGGGDHATHDIGYQQWQRREYHQPAHRVPIVMAWMVTKTRASELWLGCLEALFIRRVSKAPPDR